jgi:hypothetical protein
LVAALKTRVEPWLRDHPRLTLPPLVAAAAVGQLACALNEGGAHQQAERYFSRPEVRAFPAKAGPLAWSGPMLLRNEAHCRAWHDHSIRRALECAEQAAQRDTSPANCQSVANTLCEIHLVAGDPRAAWTAVESEYTSVRQHLDRHYNLRLCDFSGPPLARFHHSFGSLYVGVCARLSLGIRSHREGEAEHDAELLESMLAIDHCGISRRPMPLGGVSPIPVAGLHANLAGRFARISAVVLKPRFEEEDVRVISSVAEAISSAAR